MTTVGKRAKALQDLEELAIYLGQSSPALAERFLAAAERAFAILGATDAKIASHFPLSSPQLYQVRYFPIPGFPSHFMFFLPTTSGIDVVRVLHGASDLGRMLARE